MKGRSLLSGFVMIALLICASVIAISALTPAAAPVEKSAVSKATTGTVDIVNITANHIDVAEQATRLGVAKSPGDQVVSRAKALTGDIYEATEVNAYKANERGCINSPPSSNQRTSTSQSDRTVPDKPGWSDSNVVDSQASLVRRE